MTVLVAKLIWGLGCVAYFIIRYPHQRRARKTNVTDRRDLVRERTLMLMSYSGLFVVPLIYVLTDQPKFASYRFSPIQASLGALVLIAAMALLYRTHRDLGRAWSITLEIRDKHTLITRGNLREAASSDVCCVLVVGYFTGAVAPQLDRRPVGNRWLWHAILRACWP
jgi:hypothetical protein